MSRRNLFICLLFGLFSIIALVGCCDSERSTPVPAEPVIIKTLGPDGIPLPEYRAGAGVAFEFRTPEDGTIYIVEMSRKRILVSMSKKKDEEVQFDQDAIETLLKYSMRGLGLHNTNVVLFFVPQRLAGYTQMRAPSELPIEEAGAGIGAISGIAGNVE